MISSHRPCRPSPLPPLLRTYPPRFGKFLQKLHPRLLKERVVEWDLPSEVLNQDLHSFFASQDWGDLWTDANMVSVLCYLRGSIHLHLGQCRDLFPEEL